MEYDHVRDVLYVSTYGHPSPSLALLTIDPKTGQTLRTESVGSTSSAMAISDDGQFLYVGLDDFFTIRQVRLADWTVVREFAIGYPTVGEGGTTVTERTIAYEVEVMPGAPETIAVRFNGSGGLVIYDAGVPRSLNRPVSPTFYSRITFGSSPTRLYAWRAAGDYGLWRMEVGQTGATDIDRVLQLESPRGDLVFDRGRIYLESGEVIDAETGEIIYDFEFGYDSQVTVDSGTGELIRFHIPQLFAPVVVEVYDPDTFLLLRSFGIDGVSQAPWLLSIGAGRFAMLTPVDDRDRSALHIVDTMYLSGARGEFHSLTPSRVLDTRSGLGRGGQVAKVGPGETIIFKVNGTGGVPLTGVDAVVMNVTATEPTKLGFLTLWPAGSPRPDVSNLNFLPGQTVPNLVTVAVNESGEVALYNDSGTTHVIFDVSGYYSNGDGLRGDHFGAWAVPVRVLDTRNGIGRPKGKVGDATFDLRIPSSFWGQVIPTAIVLNVTVTNPTAWSFLTVFPGGTALPTVSNLNYVAGQTVPNQVIVQLPPSGIISFRNAFGTADVVADLVGTYNFADGYEGTSGRFIPLEPFRWFDSRIDTNIFGEDGRLDDGEGLIIGPENSWLRSYVMNVTVTGASSTGFVTNYPFWAPPPNASVANFVAGQTAANHVMAVGPDTVFDVTGGPTHLIIDVFGAFTA